MLQRIQENMGTSLKTIIFSYLSIWNSEILWRPVYQICFRIPISCLFFECFTFEDEIWAFENRQFGKWTFVNFPIWKTNLKQIQIGDLQINNVQMDNFQIEKSAFSPLTCRSQIIWNHLKSMPNSPRFHKFSGISLGQQNSKTNDPRASAALNFMNCRACPWGSKIQKQMIQKLPESIWP